MDWCHKKKWFFKNVNKNDEHCMIFNNKKLIGYGLLKNISNYFILDTIIVDREYRNKGFGKKIVNSLVSNIKKPIFLLCKEKNIPFYSKLGFSINNKINFIDKDINNLKIMLKNNINLKIMLKK